MIRKAVLILTLMIVVLLAVTNVGAADNLTDEIVDETFSSSISAVDNLETANNFDEGSNGVISINEDEMVLSDGFDSNNQYEDLYLSDVDTYYNADYTDAYLTYSWNGYFNGKLIVYHGNSVVFSKIVQGNRNGAPTSADCWMLNDNNGKPVPVGLYTAKLFSNDGTILKTSPVKIGKAPTDFFVDSKTTKAGKKVTIKSYIEDDCGRAEYAKGKITLKLNGKKYSANVKNGKFSITFKAPTKAKKYKCKLIYNGDSNYRSSSVKFKLTVKKASKTNKKTTAKKKKTKFTVTVPIKFDKYSSKKVGKYTFRTIKYVKYNSNGRDYGVTTTLLKNKKPMLKSKYKATYWWHFKSGTWKNLSKTRTVTYNDVKNVDKIKVKITIK